MDKTSYEKLVNDLLITDVTVSADQVADVEDAVLKNLITKPAEYAAIKAAAAEPLKTPVEDDTDSSDIVVDDSLDS